MVMTGTFAPGNQRVNITLVFVLAVPLVAGLAIGLLVGAVLQRWPTLDLGAPRVHTPAIAHAVAEHERVGDALHDGPQPKAVTGAALTVAWIIVGAGLLGLGTLLFMVRTKTGFADFDHGASQWAAEHASSWTAGALRDLSLLGGTELTLVLILVIGAIEGRRQRSVAPVTFLAVTFVGITVVVNGVKWIVDRARPDIDRLTGFSGPSFPSGHAATSAAMFAGFALVLGVGRSPRARALLAGAGAGIATAVASSRVLLGVHWLTDVLAGLAVGWAWFALCSAAFGGRFLRFGQPVAVAEAVADIESAAHPASR
jgi:undecaprenyl-diphosphatase